MVAKKAEECYQEILTRRGRKYQFWNKQKRGLELAALGLEYSYYLNTIFALQKIANDGCIYANVKLFINWIREIEAFCECDEQIKLMQILAQLEQLIKIQQEQGIRGISF